MITRPLLLAALAAILACTPDAPPPDTSGDPGPLKAGAGQHVIDLPIGHSTAGYAQSPLLAQYKPSDDPGSPFADLFPSTRGVESPPAAKVTVFDNGHSRLVLAKIDAVFVTDVLTERVVQLAKEELGTDISHQLILNATHTHDAGCRFSRSSLVPDLAAGLEGGQRNALAHGVDTYSQESTDRVAKSVVAALKDALATMKPAKFGYAIGEDDKAAHDRRCVNDWISGPNDHQKAVTVLRVDDAVSGEPIAVLFHYAMHGTFYDQGNRNLSVDAPGYVEYAVEEQFRKPVVAMYLQGAAGDASPSGGGNDGSQAMEHAGWELGRTVMGLYDGIKDFQSTLPLQTAERWVPLSHDLLGYAPGEFFDDGAILCFQLTEGDCSITSPLDPTPANIQQVCITKTLPGEGKYQTRIASARIGDLALVTLPGEPTSAVGRDLTEKAKAEGFKDAIALGYSQDHNGYILFDKDWLSGGYEPTISLWGWKFGGYIVAQGQDLLHEMVTKKALLKHDVELPNLAPDPYTPAPPSASAAAAAVLEQPAETVERLQAVKLAFTGGDAILGTPEVALQQGDEAGKTFMTYQKNGWLPLTNQRGRDLPITYKATPTYTQKPDQSAREHRYDVRYEVPREMAPGIYRFHVTGRALLGGEVQGYELDSTPFTVKESTGLTVQAALSKVGEEVVVDATVLYPQKQPVWAPKPNASWQVENFRLVEPRYASPFAPAIVDARVENATIRALDGEFGPMAATFEKRGPPEQPFYLPGQGPGIRGTAPFAGAGHYTVAFPPGTIHDAWGNTNGTELRVEGDLE